MTNYFQIFILLSFAIKCVNAEGNITTTPDSINQTNPALRGLLTYILHQIALVILH